MVRLMKFEDFNGPPTDKMWLLAHSESLAPAERVARLEDVANLALQRVKLGQNIDTAGEEREQLRTKMWLAFMPSLRTTAAGLPHNADVAGEVLCYVRPLLKEVVIDNTSSLNGNGRNTNIEGLLAEMAVLGTILWSHANDTSRARRRVLPATARQDASVPNKRFASGFDILLDTQGETIPIQVKATSLDLKKRIKHGFPIRAYERGIVTIRVSQLVLAHKQFAPHILADAVIAGDEKALVQANVKIDDEIKNAWPI